MRVMREDGFYFWPKVVGSRNESGSMFALRRNKRSARIKLKCYFLLYPLRSNFGDSDIAREGHDLALYRCVADLFRHLLMGLARQQNVASV
jgi:hypothetical protein